ncbi:Plasmodium exported protein, unknown function [Plasmodium gonderi]|uniref:Uncharacterized protein n=1 Tax=Plasmodium gonderi TaxID=77519 RepID=A0A1Y1JVG7_PLAGO|nr:Plasmodium exported protein, unknown function [Plasmodium gonderi]GAW84373.1 Plasmodium exported protein, unknown function [Plasmodium gonderi]
MQKNIFILDHIIFINAKFILCINIYKINLFPTILYIYTLHFLNSDIIYNYVCFRLFYCHVLICFQRIWYTNFRVFCADFSIEFSRLKINFLDLGIGICLDLGLGFRLEDSVFLFLSFLLFIYDKLYFIYCFYYLFFIYFFGYINFY